MASGRPRDPARRAPSGPGSTPARPSTSLSDPSRPVRREPRPRQPLPSVRELPAAVRDWARRQRPAPLERLAERSARQRVAYAAILVVLAALPLLSATVVLSQGWRPSGDNALIGLRVHDVLTGHLPLIGQPTTGENFGSGVVSSHPGPIEFYLVAPFVLVLGPIVGLAIGAAAINSVAMAGIGWAAFRRGGLPLMGVAAAGTIAMDRSLGGNLLHDPVSSNVGALMSLLVLFLAWCVLAGDLRASVAFVFAGTFALQDHLTYLGTCSPVVLLAIVVGIWWAFQYARRGRGSEWLRTRLLVAGGLGVLLWLPVVIDEAFGDHNLTAIYQTFTGKRTAASGWSFAFKRVAEAMRPWPLFSRRVPPLGYLHTPSTTELLGGYAVLALVVGLGAYSAWKRRTDLAAFATVAVVATVAGGYSSVKLPIGAGIQPSNLRWMWTVSCFVWVALAWMAWEALLPAWHRFLDLPLGVLLGVGALAATIGTVASMELSTDRDGDTAPATDALIHQVEANLPKGTYRIRYAGGSVVVSVGPAVVHALDYRGDHLAVDLGPFTRAYGGHRAYRPGEEVDGTLLITAQATAGYGEGSTLIARERFSTGRKDGDSRVIRVILRRSAS